MSDAAPSSPNLPGTASLGGVRWSELCPWLLLFRGLRVAFMARVILLAVAGVFVTQLGWQVIEALLWDSAAAPPLVRITDRHPASIIGEVGGATESSAGVDVLAQRDIREAEGPPGALAWEAMSASLRRPDVFETVDACPYAGPLARGWAWAVQPLTRLYGAKGWRAWFVLHLAGAWTIAVWALFGGAIARIAAIYLTRGETLGPITALRSAFFKWPSTAGAPACSYVAIAIAAVPLIVVGLLLRLDLFAFLLGALWLVVLTGGLALAIMAIGLLFGWPLMWSTVAVEQTDAFDGISRGYAYLYQRPFHLVFFILVATALGLAAQVALSAFVETSIGATRWLAGVGAGEAHSTALFGGRTVVVPAEPVEPSPEAPAEKTKAEATETAAAPASSTPPIGWLGEAAGGMMRFWTGVFSWIAAAFPLAYIFPAATAIYLLLRRIIDATELGESTYDTGPERALPTLVPDATTGVPHMTAPAGAPAS